MDARVSQLEFAGFRLDRQRRQLYSWDGAPIALNSRAFETLLALVEKPGTVLSKRELMQTVWPSAVVEENNLTQAISALRKALGDTHDPPQIIKTVSGRGYCLVVSPREIPEQAPPEAVQNSDGKSRSFARWLVLPIAAVILVATLIGAWLLPRNPGGSQSGAVPAPIPSRTMNSLVVLPFSSMGAQADERVFVVGLYDEVLTQLSKVSGLQVIARSAVLRYQNDARAPADIARELHVGAVLEGTVRSMGPQLRISLQLSDADTRVSLWTGSYDASIEDLRGLFKVQGDIAEQVAKAMAVQLAPQERNQMAQVPTQSPVAYQQYLRALAAISANDFVSAVTYLESSVKADPEFADAWRRLAINQDIITATPVTSPQQHHERARYAAGRAVALNPDSSGPHHTLGNILYSEGKWEEALKEFTRANELEGTRLSPLDQQVRGQQVMMLMAIGDFDGAVRLQQRELAVNPMQLIVRGFSVVAYELKGDHVRALDEYARGRAMMPTWWGNNPGIWIALGRRDTGHLDEAIRDFPEYVLRNVLVLHADRDAAVAELGRMRRVLGTLAPVQQLNAAMFAAYYAQSDMAMDFLEAGLRSNGASFYMIWLPVFAELRQTDRFRHLLQQAGLVDYWNRHGWPQICVASGREFSCS